MVFQQVTRYFGRRHATEARNEWRRSGYPSLNVSDTGVPGLQTPPRLPHLALYPSTSMLPTPPLPLKMMGATSEFGMWEDTVAKLTSPGLRARRAYPSLVASGQSKSADIEDNIANGLTNVISYKPPVLEGQTVPDTAGFLAGTYDAMLTATKNYLVSLNVPMTVSFWHEPHNEILPAEFHAGSQKFLDAFADAPSFIKLGPILNGFLMDSVADTVKFEAFWTPALLDQWDFVACDIYQNGTPLAPGTKMPGRAAPNLVALMEKHGHPHMPIGIGEFNAHSAQGIFDAGQAFLNTPTLWFALLWVGVANSTGYDWLLDTPEKIAAYNAVLDDPRAEKR